MCFCCFVFFFLNLGKNMVPKPSSQMAQTKTGEPDLVSGYKLIFLTITFMIITLSRISGKS